MDSKSNVLLEIHSQGHILREVRINCYIVFLLFPKAELKVLDKY